ncbi:hypothetical protein [Nocardia grenadensis]|uniref:hypothetical protein n=1 Tax=Nocardia grenadensis TaxID=931537 RepID=UPI0007A37D92|nr:hypothetical protein [Nocardia grenadensis]
MARYAALSTPISARSGRSWAAVSRARSRDSWPATTDRGTLILALITTMLLAGAVAGISHSAVAVIRSVALITAGIAVTLVILRPSCG